MTTRDGILELAVAALLVLATERRWTEITLREVAEKSGVPLADLYELANGKVAVLDLLAARLDRAALETAANASDDVHDRLFDATMARIEAMEPHREALTAIAAGGGLVALAGHLPRTARAILETAGIDATPPRVAAMTAVWARTAQVWRDDTGALNRTMAEIDRRLKQMRERLGRIGAGF